MRDLQESMTMKIGADRGMLVIDRKFLKLEMAFWVDRRLDPFWAAKIIANKHSAQVGLSSPEKNWWWRHYRGRHQVRQSLRANIQDVCKAKYHFLTCDVRLHVCSLLELTIIQRIDETAERILLQFSTRTEVCPCTVSQFGGDRPRVPPIGVDLF